MSGPLIPYFEAPEIPLSFLLHLPVVGEMLDPSKPPSIKPFGTLVALGVYIGAMVTVKRATERGLHVKLLNDLIFWAVASGFIFSHFFDAIFYHPETVLRDPLYLLRIWDGLSSYGGFLGAIIGAVAWKMHRRQNMLEFGDIMVSAMPLAWVFGRSGCSVVHDHPGALSNAWFAVQYPAEKLQEGFAGRFDLGLMEMVLTIPLALACHLLWRRQPFRAPGFYIGFTLTCYAPVRFVLDFFRVQPEDTIFHGSDPRYYGLTWAQWVCFLALGTGIYFLRRTYNAEYVGTAELDPDVVADLDKELEDESPASEKKPSKSAKAAQSEPEGDASSQGKKRKKRSKKAAKVDSPEPSKA